MTFREEVPLAPRTTLHVGGSARVFAVARAEEDIQAAFREAKRRGLLVRALGAGSNILVPEEGVDALVLQIAIPEIAFEEVGDDVLLIAGAGEYWDDAVDAASMRGLWGIENLAGIPGSVGGAVVQNIGAYGAELKDVFAYAQVIDGENGETRRIVLADAAFAYRESVFKHNPALLITHLALKLSKTGAPNLSYADLARAKESGERLSTPAEVASAVRTIRGRKFPTPEEGGTAGSFFKNPSVTTETAERLRRQYPELPVYPQGNGTVKVSLAWLLDHALSLKGYARGAVRLYEKQPLVLLAEHGAKARDVEALAHEVETRVQESLGITIEREVETFRA